MKKLAFGMLALGLTFGPSIPALGWCVTVQNARCDSGAFAELTCVPQLGASCSRDGGGCRPGCEGAGSWDECDPACPGGPDLQLP